MQTALNVHILEADRPAGAPTLLLAHGYGCDQSMWQQVAQALPETRRILFDWPGAGGADPTAYDAQRHATLDGYADDLLTLMSELDLRDTVVVGHSVGASVAALAARRDPSRFGLLAMLSPSPCFSNDLPHYRGGFERAQLEDMVRGLAEGQAAWARSAVPMVMANPERPALGEQWATTFCAMDPAIALRWARATFLSDIRSLIPEVTVPCLLLPSSDDALAPVEVGRWLAAQLPCNHYELLQATGHCPHVSAPIEVAHALRRHLVWRG